MVCDPPQQTSSSLLPHRHFKGFLVSRSYIAQPHICCLHSTARCSLSPRPDTPREVSLIVFYTTVTSLANTKWASKGFTPIQPSSHETDVKRQSKSRPSLEMKKHQEETGSFHKEHPSLGKLAWDWWQGLMKDPSAAERQTSSFFKCKGHRKARDGQMLVGMNSGAWGRRAEGSQTRLLTSAQPASFLGNQ